MKTGEFTHFIAPLVQDFEVAAAGFENRRLPLSQSRLDRRLLMAHGLPAPIEWKPVEIGHCEHKDAEPGKVETLVAIVETRK